MTGLRIKALSKSVLVALMLMIPAQGAFAELRELAGSFLIDRERLLVDNREMYILREDVAIVNFGGEPVEREQLKYATGLQIDLDEGNRVKKIVVTHWRI